MAKDTRKAFGLRALGAIASTVVGLALAATPAYALSVSGADSYVSAGQRQITVLTVDGSTGETIYVRVTRDGEVIADRLEYTIGDVADESYGFVSLDFSGTEAFDPSRSYVVSAYTSRDEDAAFQVFESAIRPVMATLAGGGSQLIGVSTKGEADDAFVAPESIVVGEDRVFTLEPSEDGSTLSYTAADSSASVTGTLSYVTDDGTVVASTTVDGITPTQSQTVPVAATVQGPDGTYYRVVRISANVELTYLASSATVRVKEAKAQDGYYVGQVRMVAEDGTVLATDTVSVTKKFAYTAPSSVSVAAESSTGRLRYETYVLVGEGVATFEPGDARSTSGEAVTFTYHKVTAEEATDPVVWTVVVENIAAEQTRNREIERIYYQVNPGETATYVVSDNTYTDADGNTLVPVGSSKGATLSYEYGSGANPVAHVYVAPETYEDPLELYEVTVNYVNIATREVIRTEVVDVRETNADTTISFPGQFVDGGTTYVLIAGQEAFAHNYFSRTRTYTVYYRDANDTANASVVIRRLTTVTLPGDSIFEDGGTTNAGVTQRTDGGVSVTGGTVDGDTGVGGTTDDGATVIGTPDDDTVTIDDGETATITTDEGEDIETVRIEDEETPLASADDLQGDTGVTLSTTIALTAAFCAALMLFVVAWKRRQAATSNNADNDGEEK